MKLDRLDDVVAAVRDDEAPAGAAESAAARVWERLEPHTGGVALEAIHGCADVRALLPAHRRAELKPARALLVEDHLRDCAACRAAFREPGGRRLAILPWRAASPEAAAEAPSFRRYAVAASVLLAVSLLAWGARQAFFAPASGSRAIVQSVSGALHRLEGGRALALAPGAALGEGDAVRTARGSRAVLRLRDGSSLEMGERAELNVTARGQDTTVHLERGSIIVEAAKRRSGRLLVASSDCTVSVTGTVFSVNRGIKGSRVSVLEGQVRVARGGQPETLLAGGEQWTTSQAVGEVPLADEIAWSADAERHLALIAEWGALRQKWVAVETPGVRYESRLLAAMPDDTVVFASLPNYGESLAQAHGLFEERLQESQVLRDWWRKVDPASHGGPRLAEVIDRIRSFSDFLGEEVVFAAVDEGQQRRIVPLLVAEVGKPGLREFVDEEIRNARPDVRQSLRIVGEEPAVGAAPGEPTLYVLLRPGLVAVASDERTLLALDARWQGGGAGLDRTPFGQRILEAYPGGVGLLFAADLERMTAAVTAAGGGSDARQQQVLQRSGLDGLRYLVLERKIVAEEGQTQAVLAFAGVRRGIASWLAAPAPMGALDFVSPYAQGAAAFVFKGPSLIFDDLLGLVASSDSAAGAELARLESKLDLNLREDLAATLGGELALALDGPLLPTPAWKLVLEVYDPARLQASLERLVARASDEAASAGRPGIRLESEQVGAETYHSLRGELPIALHYAFAGGYVVVAPSRALVMKAIRTFESGETLGRSAAFRALFPPGRDAHVSGVVYQDMGPTIRSLMQAPGASQLSGDQRQTFEALAGNARATLVSFYGEDDGIRVAGTGSAFNLDGAELALPLLLERAIGGLPRQANP